MVAEEEDEMVEDWREENQIPPEDWDNKVRRDEEFKELEKFSPIPIDDEVQTTPSTLSMY